MRLYRLFLLLLPASFRAEFETEILATMAQSRGNSLLFWPGAFADLVTTAAAAHWDLLVQDLRYAVRSARRSPGYSASVVTVAALGIGAASAAFTMANHVLLRPLPFPEPDRLVQFMNINTATGATWGDLSPLNYQDWKRAAKSFSTMGAWSEQSTNLVGAGEPRQLSAAAVTADLLPILGAQPAIGRLFASGEDSLAEPATVVLSDALWRSAYAGDPGIVGRRILLDGLPHTVIGVMPATFHFPSRETALWTATRWQPAVFAERDNYFIFGLGRLKPGVTLAAAQAEMRRIGDDIARAFPKDVSRTTAGAFAYSRGPGTQQRLILNLLLGTALCVLLVACCNLANLAAARAAARERELAMRIALGAGRERLTRLMLTDSLVLAMAGGLAGLALASASLPLLVRLIPVNLPIEEMPTTDWRVVLFAAAAVLVTALSCALLPGLRARGFTQETARISGSARQTRARSVLVIAQVSGAVVLLVTFGLLTRALLSVQSVAPGFRTANVITLRTTLPMPKYEAAELREAYYDRVLTRVRALPGVQDASWVSFLPMVTKGGAWPVDAIDRPQPRAERQIANLRFVTPGYFRTMGIPLLAGRDVTPADNESAPGAVIISRSFAERYWHGENALGRRINFGNRERTVIAVVGDVKMRGPERNADPQAYLSWRQPRGVFQGYYAPKDLVVRSTRDALRLGPALRAIIHEADPAQPVSDLQLLQSVVDAETAPRRTQVLALGVFATLAFLLAAIGIHALLSFTVAGRTKEIGVRMALGARAGQIAAMTLREALRLAVIGIVVGSGAAALAGRALQSMLIGVTPSDTLTFAAAISLALLMTLAGGLPPAVRAARMDPVRAIRAE